MREITNEMYERFDKEDKFISALFYDNKDREGFDLTILGMSDGVDDTDPKYINDKAAYLKTLIGNGADRFLNRFKDDLSDFEEIYILGKIKKDERPKKKLETNKE